LPPHPPLCRSLEPLPCASRTWLPIAATISSSSAASVRARRTAIALTKLQDDGHLLDHDVQRHRLAAPCDRELEAIDGEQLVEGELIGRADIDSVDRLHRVAVHEPGARVDAR